MSKVQVEDCELCKKDQGTYQLTRLCCAARLVAKAGYHKPQAEGLYGAIERVAFHPVRRDIEKRVEQILEARYTPSLF